MTRVDPQVVLIIGAGAAGLAAAVELSRSGKNVTVLEGRNRIGGRIHTVKNPQVTVPIELGAEFIHGKSPEILQIVQSGKLTLADLPERHWRLQNGKVTDNASFFSDIEKIMKRMRRLKKDISFRDFLKAAKVSSNSAKTATLYVEGFHASNAGRIGIQGLNRYNEAAKKIEEDREFRLIEGYDSLARWMYKESASNGATFHFNTIVRQIRWRKNAVVVSGGLGKDIQEYSSQAVIITVPLSVLQRKIIHFEPPIKAKQEAVDYLAMGHVIKIIFLFRERFWEDLKFSSSSGKRSGFDLGFIHSPEEEIPTWWTQVSLRTPLLVGWTGGPNAERLLKIDPEKIVECGLDSLQKILRVPRKELEALLEETYMHNWSADELSSGAYSYVPVGGLSAQKNLSEPVLDTLFFAGEAATTDGATGTVHGAIASGQRAARQLLK